MNKEIKKYVDEQEVNRLKYIFADALDIDPTFERYQEEFEYCKTKGILEPYVELTPFQLDKANWDEEYWSSLKWDLQENFSEKRMLHMCEVAEIVRAEKIQRLRQERAERAKQELEEHNRAVEQLAKERRKANRTNFAQAEGCTTENNIPTSNKREGISRKAEQEQQLKKAKQELEEHNRAVEQEQIEKERRKVNRNNSVQTSECKIGTNNPKKAIGIAVAVLLVVIIILQIYK